MMIVKKEKINKLVFETSKAQTCVYKDVNSQSAPHKILYENFRSTFIRSFITISYEETYIFS